MRGRRLFAAGLAAILGASFAGSAMFAILGYLGDLLFFVPTLLAAVVVATVHFLLLGLPLVLLVAMRGRVRWWNSALAGALVGGFPLPAFLLLNARDLDGVALTGAQPLFLALGGAGLVGGLAFRGVYGTLADEEVG